jgi:hypothetical protein
MLAIPCAADRLMVTTLLVLDAVLMVLGESKQ